MGLFKNTRLKIGRSLLRKRAAKSDRKLVYNNFSQVKSIGMVWNASKYTEFQALARFHQKMQEKNIDVKILGYYDGKILPDQYTALRYLRCFRKEEISFFCIPESADVLSFINNRFDVLIDINFEKIFALTYISTLSKASLKTGLYEAEGNNTPFDLMMEISRPVNVDDYLTRVLQYLEMINS
jgi:uncharacterized protein YfeS